MVGRLSFLDLVRACDNFFDDVEPGLIPWCITSAGSQSIIGLLRPVVVDQLVSENKRSRERGEIESWDILYEDGKVTKISFASHLTDDGVRSKVMKELCERWRDGGLFPDIIGPRAWRSELYSICIDPLGPRLILDYSLSRPHSNDNEKSDAGKSNYAFDLERSACALFGVVTYGIHMTIYKEDEDGTYRIWVPKRAKTKQTWPGCLDNSVAGGIPTGMGTLESLVKESMEEASIEEEIIRKYARAVGSISYFYRTSKGWLQPEIEYIYDLRVPAGVDSTPFSPKPLDDEVESFELLPLDDVVLKMRTGLFKPNCACLWTS